MKLFFALGEIVLIMHGPFKDYMGHVCGYEKAGDGLLVALNTGASVEKVWFRREDVAKEAGE